MDQRDLVKNYDCRDALNDDKHAGISALDSKINILKKIKVSFIIHFCLDKYSFCSTLLEYTSYS